MWLLYVCLCAGAIQKGYILYVYVCTFESKQTLSHTHTSQSLVVCR